MAIEDILAQLDAEAPKVPVPGESKVEFIERVALYWRDMARMWATNETKRRETIKTQAQDSTSRMRELGSEIGRIEAELAQANSFIRGQSKRIGELAASNFGLRIRAKTAEKELKRVLKMDRKARKAGLMSS